MKLSLLTVNPSNVANKYPGIFGLIKFRWLKTHNPLNSKKYSGALLFLTGVLAFLGIITAETLYPGYSTAQNIKINAYIIVAQLYYAYCTGTHSEREARAGTGRA